MEQADAIRNITGYFIDYIFQPEAAIGGQYVQNGEGVFERGNDISRYGSSLTINSSARQEPTPKVSDGMIFDASTVVPTAAALPPVPRTKTPRRSGRLNVVEPSPAPALVPST